MIKKRLVFSALIMVFHFTYAAELPYSTPTPILKKIGKDYFVDREGRVIYYPCSMGGEPLVIYSSLDDQPISSKSTWYPVYLESGYQATPLSIPSFETSERTSRKNLIIETINPADAYLSFQLTRQDFPVFYVDTANFAIVDTVSGEEGTLQKYVSTFSVNIDHLSTEFKHVDVPIYNYHFEEDAGLYVYSYVTQIQSNIASWNQNTNWTDGSLGRNLAKIPYRFSPLKIKKGSGYDGFGFWICGSNKKEEEHTIGDKKSYVDNLNSTLNEEQE